MEKYESLCKALVGPDEDLGVDSERPKEPLESLEERGMI